ncbi:MAG: D-serine deaminase-like pyridoxal phosphate-dependent protein [Planctomycetota bacterium]|jgi:D-serine deaminase-like pyridoxal phosphate-dependent protein
MKDQTKDVAPWNQAAGYQLPDDFSKRVISPALVIYLDRVRHNLQSVIDRAGSVERWRPHVKTAKIPAVFAEYCRAGVAQFKCATTREAHELLRVMRTNSVANGDLLIAYPMTGPALIRLKQLAYEYSEFRLSVLCESAQSLVEIPENLSIFVDVNPGMHRTGIPLAQTETILNIAGTAGSRFRGIHYYDGHLHQDDPSERRTAAFECYDQLFGLLGELESSDIPVGEVITCGTPTYPHALAYPEFEKLSATAHRISPGTVVYHDLRSHELEPDSPLLPAALVHARVVSHPSSDIVTCDAGSKSIAAEAGDPVAIALGFDNLNALSPSEEHLPFRVLAGEAPARGTCLQLFPRHVCPTVNLASEAILMDGSEVVDVVQVSARAHEILLAD